MALLVVKMYLKAKDLGDAWKKINVGLMSGEIPNKAYIGKCVPDEPLVVLSETSKCNLNIECFGYGTRKLDMLKRKYFDEEEFNSFIGLVNNGKSAMYYFKSSKVYAGRKKPNCLICIIYESKKDLFSVVWRTTELISRFAADLIFLSEILKGKRVKLIILESYQYLQIIYGVFKMNGVGFKKPKDEKYAKAVLISKEFFPDHIDFEFYERWQPIKLVQKSYKRYLKRKEN